MIELLLTLVGENRDMKMTEVATGLHEDVPGGLLLIIAYGVIVALVLGFVARLAVKQSRVDAVLTALEKASSQHSSAEKR